MIESPLELTVVQAARRLGVSKGTVRRWSDAGYLECYRTPGGQRRYNPQQLDRFLSRIRKGSSNGRHVQ